MNQIAQFFFCISVCTALAHIFFYVNFCEHVNVCVCVCACVIEGSTHSHCLYIHIYIRILFIKCIRYLSIFYPIRVFIARKIAFISRFCSYIIFIFIQMAKRDVCILSFASKSICETSFIIIIIIYKCDNHLTSLASFLIYLCRRSVYIAYVFV